jgi:hypothetical protein
LQLPFPLPRGERESCGDSSRPRSGSSLLPLSDVDGNGEVALPILPSASIQIIEPLPPSQEECPLLDVHPIHAPLRAWRDFFIHIATIVVGLCIAVGIQQTVEFFHHRHQLTELRQALRLEREVNYKTLTENTTSWRWGTAELQNNLLVFQYLLQHPGAPQEELPGVLLWATSPFAFVSAAWDAAHQSGLVALLTREEIEANSFLYSILKQINDIQLKSALAVEDAERYDLVDANPSHLSPAEINTEIQLTHAALAADYLRGISLLDLVGAFHDFPATITSKELRQMRHAPPQPTSASPNPARALTMERMKAAGYVDSKPLTEIK